MTMLDYALTSALRRYDRAKLDYATRPSYDKDVFLTETENILIKTVASSIAIRAAMDWPISDVVSVARLIIDGTPIDWAVMFVRGRDEDDSHKLAHFLEDQ